MSKAKSKEKRPTARQKAAAEALWASEDMQNLSNLTTGLLKVPKAELDAKLAAEKRPAK